MSKREKSILEEIASIEAADAFVADFNQFIEDVRARRPWKAILQLLERKHAEANERVKSLVTEENKDIHNFYAGQVYILDMLLKSDGMGLHDEMETAFAARDLWRSMDAELEQEGGEEEE
jgi:hypothetical protein